MELLLVSEQEIPSGKAPSAFWAFERLFLGVRSLVSLQVLESRE